MLTDWSNFKKFRKCSGAQKTGNDRGHTCWVKKSMSKHHTTFWAFSWIADRINNHNNRVKRGNILVKKQHLKLKKRKKCFVLLERNPRKVQKKQKKQTVSASVCAFNLPRQRFLYCALLWLVHQKIKAAAAAVFVDDESTMTISLCKSACEPSQHGQSFLNFSFFL